MIVKVQLSIFDSRGRRMLLVYNEDRSLEYMSEATAEDIANLKDRPKSFVHAEIDPKDGTLHLGDPAPWQDW